MTGNGLRVQRKALADELGGRSCALVDTPLAEIEELDQSMRDERTRIEATTRSLTWKRLWFTETMWSKVDDVVSLGGSFGSEGGETSMSREQLEDVADDLEELGEEEHANLPWCCWTRTFRSGPRKARGHRSGPVQAFGLDDKKRVHIVGSRAGSVVLGGS